MMNLKCLHCSFIFKSLLIDKNAALQEITKRLADHLVQNHAAVQQSLMIDITTVSQLSAFMVLVLKHTTYLNEDDAEQGEPNQFIEEQIELGAERIRTALGLPEPQEDDEDEEDEEDLTEDGLDTELEVIKKEEEEQHVKVTN